MNPMPIRWKVRPLLEAKNTTNYRFWKDSGLSRDVAYAIANNEHQALDAKVIEKLLPYLHHLTGNRNLQIGDVLEWIPEQEKGA